MTREGMGSIFRRKDGKYFVYLPRDVAEDTAFPYQLNSSQRVRVRFTDEGRIIIEPAEE